MSLVGAADSSLDELALRRDDVPLDPGPTAVRCQTIGSAASRFPDFGRGSARLLSRSRHSGVLARLDIEGSSVRGLRASDISTRVATLVGRRHRGNQSDAAKYLGIDPESLAGLLSSDWRLFSLDALAALIREYHVSADWLVGSMTPQQLDRSAVVRLPPLRRKRTRTPTK
jgi:hypothetical protein